MVLNNKDWSWPKVFGGSAALVVLLSIVGILLLTLSYCLPVSHIAQNIANSSSQISKEGVYPVAELNNTDAQLDNFTDALMINTAVFPQQSNPLVSAVSASYASSSADNDQISSLASLVSEGEYSKTDYFRYWHGYLFPLKIWLAAGFDLQSIRYINFFIFLLLVCLIAVVAIRRKRVVTLVPLLMLCVSTHIVVLEYSLQFYSVYVITLVAALLLLLLKDYSPKKLAIVFTMVGALTSYFDLLTAPLLTLGIPLCVCLMLLLYEREKQMLSATVVGVVFWAGGYFGMWAMKIAISCLILGPDALNNALTVAQIRTDSSICSLADSVALNISHYHSYVLLWSLAFIIPVLCLVWKNKDFNLDKKECIQFLVSISIVCVLPFIWMGVFVNHSAVHNFMVYRIIAISLAALSCAVIFLVPKGIKSLEDRGNFKKKSHI